MYWILDKGTVEGKMTYDPSHEEWKVVVVKIMPGTNREAGVVVAFQKETDYLEVITVEWMDIGR